MKCTAWQKRACALRGGSFLEGSGPGSPVIKLPEKGNVGGCLEVSLISLFLGPRASEAPNSWVGESGKSGTLFLRTSNSYRVIPRPDL